MDIVLERGYRKNVIVDGVKTILIGAYKNPYGEQWNQYDCQAGTEKPVMHTAHSLPVSFGKMERGTRIKTSGHTYEIL